jgi:aromatic ring hydroxylase
MQFSYEMKRQIREWVEADKLLQKQLARLAAANKARSQCFAAYNRSANQLRSKLQLEIQRISRSSGLYSLKERSELIRQQFQAFQKALRKTSGGLQRDLGKTNLELARATTAVGQRRGHLKLYYKRNFIELSERMEKRKANSPQVERVSEKFQP